MSFRYDVLNLEILDTLKEIFAKPSSQWTEDELKRASIILAAMEIVINQCPHKTYRLPWD